jgi:hypothetical protein
VPNDINAIESLLLKNGLHRIEFNGTDYSWGFRENEPIISILLSQNDGTTYQKAMRLYWATADYVAKPWCLLITLDNLAQNHIDLLENISKQYNISLTKRNELLSSISIQLVALTSILREYIPQCTVNPLKELGESVKSWKEDKPVKEYNYEVNIRTGNLEIYKENEVLVPSRITIPLMVTANETRIEGILPRLVNIDKGLFFDTEHRNLPMAFKMRIGNTSELTLRFEADKSNINEATIFWSLYQEFMRTNRLLFIEPNTGDTLFNCLRELDGRGNN